MDYNVLADVSRTLKELLEAGLANANLPGQVPHVLVHNLTSAPSAPAVTLFLYEVTEDPSARNRPRVRLPHRTFSRLRKPDLALLLRYLVTPWIANLDPPYTDHLILARLAQVLYEKALLSGPDLRGSTLPDTDATLSVTMAPLTLEDRTRIWTSVNLPYRLSLSYEVRVARIEPEAFRDVAAVTQGSFAYGDVVGEEA